MSAEEREGFDGGSLPHDRAAHTAANSFWSAPGCARCQREGVPATPDAGDASDAIRVTLTVDTDELREWAGRHADAGHHGVAHVLYKAASDGESLSEQALREARDAERAAWSIWLHSWMNAVGPTPPTVEDVAKALREGQRPFGAARGDAQ